MNVLTNGVLEESVTELLFICQDIDRTDKFFDITDISSNVNPPFNLKNNRDLVDLRGCSNVSLVGKNMKINTNWTQRWMLEK